MLLLNGLNSFLVIFGLLQILLSIALSLLLLALQGVYGSTPLILEKVLDVRLHAQRILAYSLK